MEIELRGHYLEGLQRHHAAPSIEYELTAKDCGRKAANLDELIYNRILEHDPDLAEAIFY